MKKLFGLAVPIMMILGASDARGGIVTAASTYAHPVWGSYVASAVLNTSTGLVTISESAWVPHKISHRSNFLRVSTSPGNKEIAQYWNVNSNPFDFYKSLIFITSSPSYRISSGTYDTFVLTIQVWTLGVPFPFGWVHTGIGTVDGWH